MTQQITTNDESGDPSRRENTQKAALFFVSFIMLVGTIWIAPVNRTQEARVLESAREMYAQSARGWLIPHANGIVRLQKPPLAYWLSASFFKVFGVKTWIGRLPMALCGWLVVIATYQIARRLFDAHIALVGGWLLVGSFLFFRHARLAETDVLVTLAITLAIGAILRAGDDVHDLKWFALSGVAIGVAGIAKGPPALFAILFLICLAVGKRRSKLIARWAISGAPIIALSIALPWWIFARLQHEGAIVNHELDNLLDGGEHFGWFWEYFPMLAKAALPWSPVLAVAIVAAVRRLRTQRGIPELLIWIGSIFVPLCIIASKQDHYLLPLMPALAIVTGWWLMRVARGYARCIAITCAIAMTIGVGIIAPLRQVNSPREIAAKLRAMHGTSYYFYGPNFSLPLVFELRTVIPQIKTPEELQSHKSESAIVIAQTKSDQSPPPIPAGFDRVQTIFARDQKFEIYRAK